MQIELVSETETVTVIKDVIVFEPKPLEALSPGSVYRRAVMT